MSILDNPKHERLAQALAAGKSLHLASQLAGYLEPQSVLARSEPVKARIAEILEEAATDAVMAAREWQERETRSARVEIRDFFDMATGLLLPMSQWPDGAAEAIDSIEYDSKTGLPSKIKLRKTGSMNNIGKMHKLLTDKVELSGSNSEPVRVITSQMTPQEAAEAYAALLNPGK